MDYRSNRQNSLPTLLFVNRDRQKLNFDSSILALFPQASISIMAAIDIVSWTQQHQPDLIILDLKWSEAVDSQLISTLRLDWLTRNIPILLITDVSKLHPVKNLDYDARLSSSCSLLELEQTICSLTSTPASRSLSKAV